MSAYNLQRWEHCLAHSKCIVIIPVYLAKLPVNLRGDSFLKNNPCYFWHCGFQFLPNMACSPHSWTTFLIHSSTQESSMDSDACSTRAECSAQNPSPSAGSFYPTYPTPQHFPLLSTPEPLPGLGRSPHHPLQMGCLLNRHLSSWPSSHPPLNGLISRTESTFNKCLFFSTSNYLALFKPTFMVHNRY